MTTTTSTPSTAIAVAEPVFTHQERLALTGFLAGYTGLTREAHALDLPQFTAWCQQRHPRLFRARRSDIECFARDLEARGRARATITRRLCTVAGFYRYAVEEDPLEHSPAAHVRRPRLDYESHATGWIATSSGQCWSPPGGIPAGHALISLLALNGLRVSEAIGANIEALGAGRGHRTLVVTCKGGKVVTVPLAPRTARATDLVIGERCDGPVFVAADGRRLDRHGAGRMVRRAARRAGIAKPAGPHPAACVHHRRAGRRGLAAGRAGSRLPRRSPHHHAIRPRPRQPGPARHLHRRLRRRGRPVRHRSSDIASAWPEFQPGG
jgi:site-specific recombinase XerD